MVKIYFKTKSMKKFEIFSSRNFKTTALARIFLNAFKREKKNKKTIAVTGAKFAFKSSGARKTAKRKVVRKRKVIRKKTKRKATKRKPMRKKTKRKTARKRTTKKRRRK